MCGWCDCGIMVMYRKLLVSFQFLNVFTSFFCVCACVCVCVCVYQVYELEGVVQMHDAHFWTLCTGTYYGTLRLDVMAGTDLRRTLPAARNILVQVSGPHTHTHTHTHTHVHVNTYTAYCIQTHTNMQTFLPDLILLCKMKLNV